MPDELTLVPQDVIKLLAAFLVGGLIGAEREYRDKAAGLRTIILICVGSTLFTIFSLGIGSAGKGDPGRIAAQIVTGVGFLGAGVILHQGAEVRGLTTASAIWLAAALGVGIGAGQLLFSALAAGLALFVLWILPVLEAGIDARHTIRTYQVTIPVSREKEAQLEAMFRGCGLRIFRRRQGKRGVELLCTWTVAGPIGRHEQAVAKLIADPDVQQFQF